jgi:hypothetical protein
MLSEVAQTVRTTKRPNDLITSVMLELPEELHNKSLDVITETIMLDQTGSEPFLRSRDAVS